MVIRRIIFPTYLFPSSNMFPNGFLRTRSVPTPATLFSIVDRFPLPAQPSPAPYRTLVAFSKLSCTNNIMAQELQRANISEIPRQLLRLEMAPSQLDSTTNVSSTIRVFCRDPWYVLLVGQTPLQSQGLSLPRFPGLRCDRIPYGAKESALLRKPVLFSGPRRAPSTLLSLTPSLCP